MSEQDHFLDLAGRIYEIATDDARSCDLARDIAQAFASDSCLVFFGRKVQAGRPAMPQIAGILSGTENFDGWACSAYTNYYHDRDAWYARAWQRPAPYVVLGEELIATAELLRTEWSDYLRATGTLYVLGAEFPIENDLIGLVGIHRSPGEQPFDESDRNRMKRLLPHLQRALRIREQIRSAERKASVAGGLLETLAIAIVVVDADRRIGFVNEVAERVLKTGHSLRATGNVLQAGLPADQAAIEAAVQAATRPDRRATTELGSTLVLGSGGAFGLSVMVAPLPRDSILFGCVHPACVVIFADPANSASPSVDVYSRQYGLTPAQSRLLGALVQGQELARYAQASKVALGTVKAHLKEILSKTGQHRQADLIRMVLSDPLCRVWPALGHP